MFKKLYGYLERIATGTERLFVPLAEIIRLLNVMLQDKHEGNEPLPEPVPPGEDGWYEWWKRPMEDWPTHVDTLRVGYVRVSVDKSPLYTLNDVFSTDVPVIYEDEDLRENDTTDAKRIIAKEGKWLMVYVKGDVYANVRDKNVRPFGENIDGDGLYYRVMNEQIVDGIALWDYNVKLFVRYDHTDDTYINGL